jgi:predicted NBD/HSP70 family sugar kinase
VSSINQRAIVQVLREHGPLSRVRIGELTGLSPATVNRLTSAMVREGLIVRHGQEPSTGGRPSLIFRYTGGARVVVSVQLRGDRAIGALVDFDGRIVHRYEASFTGRRRPGADVNRRLEVIGGLVDELLRRADELDTPCLSIGVSVPGVVAASDGGIGPLPELGWPKVPLRQFLRSRIELPLTIENDANALAFGEYRRGAGIGCSSMVAILLDNGMGAGIITNGSLHRGYHFEAGEIGYMLMDRSSLSKAYEGDLGDLEDRVGSVALTRAARENGLPVPEQGLITAHDIIELADSGNEVAAAMLEEILDMVSMAVAALTVIIDPEVIVVGSGLNPGADHILTKIEQRLTGRILRVPRLLPSSLGPDAVLLGVAELAMAEVDPVDFVPR